MAFEDILKEDVSQEVNTIFYTATTMMVMAEDDIPMLERKMNSTLKVKAHWIESDGLSLATTKMEVVGSRPTVVSVPLLSSTRGGDKVLYSTEVFGIVV